MEMTFKDRQRQESLAGHLLRNAGALGLSRGQQARLSVAWRLMLGTNAERNEGGRIATEVRDQLAADVQAVVDAAIARGEKVTTYNDDGAKRIKTRDGLGMLLESGGIDETQHKAGMAYRYCYEVASAGLRSGLGAPGHIASTGGDRDKGELHRLYVISRLAQMERTVAASAQDGRETIVLRQVAGEGRTIRSFSTGGHARRLDAKALKRALDAVAKVLPAGGLRITGH